MLAQGDDLQDRKMARLRSEVIDADNEKSALKAKVEKLESQKTRLEDIFKATMKGGTMDLIDQV